MVRLSPEERELVTHAALAAGYEMGAAEGRPEHEVHTWTQDYDEYLGLWNPLESSSSAFQLAVDAKISLIVGDDHSLALGGGGMVRQSHGDDKHAASRLAIVMAAAAQFTSKSKKDCAPGG